MLIFLGRLNLSYYFFRPEFWVGIRNLFLTSFKIAVNGTDVSKDTFHGNRIHLKDSLLKSGEKNQMHVIYVNDFNHDGAGFHQFIDPEDKQVRNKNKCNF